MSESADAQEVVALVGGGTGGHIIPLKIITQRILTKNVKYKVVVVTNTGYFEKTKQIFTELTDKYGERVEIRKVAGGRFRRYGRSKLRELLDIKTQLLNLRDLFKSLVGVVQSKLILRSVKPAVIFCKGGTGALEFCFAARKRAPIIVHDSDSRPGMTNGIVSKWAFRTLTGMPKNSEEASLSEDKNLVGIPVSKEFKPSSEKQSLSLRAELGLDLKAGTVLVTGGSLGAAKINELIFCTIDDLNKLGIQILHQTGSSEMTKRAKTIRKQLKNPKLYRPFSFSSAMPTLYGASDLVVARAGATTIQELANSLKPAILIPASLTDQKKNAGIIKELGAALVADQDELLNKPEEFISMVQFALGDSSFRDSIKDSIRPLARYDVGEEIAELLLSLIKNSKSE
jgi:UDP-N-acetylglucosamine--N-acetylmuramyl-(pentapeptide) pyrophosphoryl-undecaprenol N-acetylglucosamine transferase